MLICLLNTPRTVRLSEKLSFGKFKPADPSFEKKDFSRICENKISVESVQMILKLSIWNICLLRSNRQNYSHLKALYIKAYIGKIVLVLIDVILSKIIFSEPYSFMHMFNVSIVYTQLQREITLIELAPSPYFFCLKYLSCIYEHVCKV